jgi:protein SCO1/2
MKINQKLQVTIIWSAIFLFIGTTFATETNVVCPSCCRLELPAAKFTDRSIYQVESAWTNDGHQQIRLGALAGKPQVVLMFFSHCTTACPILLNDLKRIRAALTPEEQAAVGFTLVSMDAERDTPDALAEYRKAWNIPDEHWTLLSGRPDDILELATLLGIQFKKTADGQFAHSNVITILDARGEIVHQQAGLNEDINETVRVLQRLAIH